MRLQELPVEVLRTIFDGDDSSLVIELWKAGDHALRDKLANGGVSHMVLTSREMMGAYSRWPRCLKHLKLISLQIESQTTIGSPQAIRNELNSMYRGLKRLTVSSYAVARAFFDSFNDSSLGSLQNPHSIPTTEDSELEACDLRPSLFRFRDIFPELEYLAITGSFHLTAESMLLLPDSLTSLIIAELPSKLRGSYSFPPRLMCLSTFGRLIDLPELKILPSSLTSLDALFTSAAYDWFYSEAGQAHFPELATFLPFTTDRSPAALSRITTSKAWQRLASITFPRLQRTEILSLIWPRSLTCLSCPDRSTFCSIDLLPASLTKLVVGRLDWGAKKPSDLQTFLPRLKSLVLVNEPEFDVNHFYMLPRNLESLILRYNGSSSAEDQPEEKRLAAEFTDFIASFVLEYDCENASRLFELSNGGNSPGYSSENIRGIERGLHYGLPLTLNHLDFSKSVRSPYNVTIVLPPSVTYAIIPNRWCADPELLLRSLPRTITHLELPQGSGGEISFLDAWEAVSASRDLSHLVSLRLSNFLPTNAQNLPINISSLLLNSDPSPDPCPKLTLPPLLNNFETNILCFEVSLLPSSLVSCSLPSMRGEDIRHLPLRLRYLTVTEFLNTSTVQIRGIPMSVVQINWQELHLNHGVPADPNRITRCTWDPTFGALFANRHRLSSIESLSSIAGVERWVARIRDAEEDLAGYPDLSCPLHLYGNNKSPT